MIILHPSRVAGRGISHTYSTRAKAPRGGSHDTGITPIEGHTDTVTAEDWTLDRRNRYPRHIDNTEISFPRPDLPHSPRVRERKEPHLRPARIPSTPTHQVTSGPEDGGTRRVPRYRTVGVLLPRQRTRYRPRSTRIAGPQICQDCPVLTQCREYALAVGEPYGIWVA